MKIIVFEVELTCAAASASRRARRSARVPPWTTGITPDRRSSPRKNGDFYSACFGENCTADDKWQASRGVWRVLIYHNRHTDQAAAEPQENRLLPLESGRFEEIAERDWPFNMVPLFTMDADRLFSALVREYLFVVLCRACAESLASEHASRLASMQAAERNIEERLEEINVEYRRRRQQAITGELLDVVSGFEVLQGENDAG